MSAIVPAVGPLRTLDQPAEPDEQITPDQVEDTSRMARLLMRIVRDVARLRRRWAPRFIEFEGRVVDATGTTAYRFAHGFGNARVRYWVVQWSGAAAHNLRYSTASDANTLVLTSTSAGTATVRVEEGG